jgi:hypothetical protein
MMETSHVKLVSEQSALTISSWTKIRVLMLQAYHVRPAFEHASRVLLWYVV